MGCMLFTTVRAVGGGGGGGVLTKSFYTYDLCMNSRGQDRVVVKAGVRLVMTRTWVRILLVPETKIRHWGPPYRR